MDQSKTITMINENITHQRSRIQIQIENQEESKTKKKDSIQNEEP